MSHKNRKTTIKKIDKSIEIMGVPISGTQMNQVLKKIWLQRKEMLHIATVNSEYIMQARSDSAFKNVLQNCLTVADGWGVVWAIRILKSQIPNSQIDRISGVELAELMVEHASQVGERVFLLGAKEGIAEKAAKKMKQLYPNLEIAWYEGAKSVAVEKSEEASMTIAKINAFEPDYLLVAYGSPKQDIWIEENRPYLRARVAMGVGGVFDEWAGEVLICPKWLDQIGLKWLFRAVTQPWRIGRITKVLQFGALVLWHKLID